MKLVFFVLALLLSLRAEAVDVESLRTYGEDHLTTIYIFTSPSCPHCAAYHEDILLYLKKNISDKHLAQIKLVDMVGDRRSLKVVELARCMENTPYEKFVDSIYKNQSDWAFTITYDSTLSKYAETAGFNKKQQEDCLKIKGLEQTILEQGDNLSQLYKVTSLPTTVVVKGTNAKAFVGSDIRIIPEIQKLLQTN